MKHRTVKLLKKIMILLSALALGFALTGCVGGMIGTVKGAEWECIIIDGVPYVRDMDSGFSRADKGSRLGKVTDGKVVFRVYRMKSDPTGDYLFCTWDHEGMIYRRSQPLPAVAGCGPFYKDIDFSAQYVRTDGRFENSEGENALRITSVDELSEYCEQNKDRYYLGHVENPLSDQTIGFADAIEKYDEDFFAQNELILVLLEEPSGSIRHEVTRVGVYCSMLDRVAFFIRPEIKRLVPECGTCDMAGWHIIIEISKEYGRSAAELLPADIT